VAALPAVHCSPFIGDVRLDRRITLGTVNLQHLKAFRRNENLPLRNHSNEMPTRMDHSGRKRSKSSRTAIFALVGRADHFARRGIDLDRMGVSLVVTRLQDAVTHATQSGHRLRMRLSQ
jgi:hypothetical protein